ncbi:MAG: lactonase family protein [Erysipelotrichaceae bacterium]|nr:lactonase family protein [Erysipelotrichaceae bacterium]
MIFYVSSYGKKDDKGIYIINFDEESLKLTKVQQIVTIDYPSYMIINNHNLYTTYKNASSKNDGGGIGSFSIDGDELKLNSNYRSSGRSYTHLCIDKDHKYLFAANYHGGSTAAYELEDNQIAKKIGAIHHRGLGPDLLKRQTSPHVHYVGFTPDNKFLYAVDLGADKVVMYRYNNGVLNEAEDYTLNVIPGSGPRHMIFSNDGRYAYLVNEIANQIMVFKYRDGYLSMVQSTSCIPNSFKKFTSASAIRLTHSGNHLFVSNRGHDSIAMYRVNKETGKISLISMVHTGKEPRDFNIIDNKYLIIGAQGDNKLQVMLFDEENEKLTLTNSEINIPAPVCIAVNN